MWTQHGAFRHHNVDRAQAARIHWDVAFHHNTKAVKNRCTGDGFRRVEVVGLHVTGAGEVYCCFALFLINTDFDSDG